jgi:hypothetical protein
MLLPRKHSPDREPASPPRHIVFTLILLLAPILIMTCFRDRKDRYLLPMVSAGSVLSAWALSTASLRFRGWLFAHWIGLAVLLVGMPIAGAAMPRLAAMAPWFGWADAIGLSIAGLGIVVVAASFGRNRPLAVAIGTALPMLALQLLVMGPYARSNNGRSDMKDLAWDIRQRIDTATPDGKADAYYVHPERRLPPLDLAIYLNRLVQSRESLDSINRAPDASQVVLVKQRFSAKTKEPIDQPPVPEYGWQVFTDPLPRDGDSVHVLWRRSR